MLKAFKETRAEEGDETLVSEDSLPQKLEVRKEAKQGETAESCPLDLSSHNLHSSPEKNNNNNKDTWTQGVLTEA
ncbi:hypothetical protein JOB18_026392 [Solea senegalensis]|uniref:Uncharacterized protein n=1 Tax=Solea senegalensis TaxID=28829 RepID=A0AAV6SZN8_SOLSE|nr:hypothetical protein JOB18_026392 [Solea senegalensis]